ncbi:uncharacterized protein [Ptychodera flava]|uniref:uncharacterized protein isoform X1 n=1 Tax=Ptychodera flava TaxID=63121 RepID=UPI00396A2A5C
MHRNIGTIQYGNMEKQLNIDSFIYILLFSAIMTLSGVYSEEYCHGRSVIVNLTCSECPPDFPLPPPVPPDVPVPPSVNGTLPPTVQVSVHATSIPLAMTATANATIEPIKSSSFSSSATATLPNPTQPFSTTQEPIGPGNATDVSKPSPGGCDTTCIALATTGSIIVVLIIIFIILFYAYKKKKWCFKKKEPEKGAKVIYPNPSAATAESGLGSVPKSATNGDSPTHKTSPSKSVTESPRTQEHHQKRRRHKSPQSPTHSNRVSPQRENPLSKSTDPLVDPDAKYVYPGTPPEQADGAMVDQESPKKKKKKKKKQKKKSDEVELTQPNLKNMTTSSHQANELPPVNVPTLSPMPNPSKPRPLPLPPLGSNAHT